MFTPMQRALITFIQLCMYGADRYEQGYFSAAESTNLTMQRLGYLENEEALGFDAYSTIPILHYMVCSSRCGTMWADAFDHFRCAWLL